MVAESFKFDNFGYKKNKMNGLARKLYNVNLRFSNKCHLDRKHQFMDSLAEVKWCTVVHDVSVIGGVVVVINQVEDHPMRFDSREPDEMCIIKTGKPRIFIEFLIKIY